MKKIGVIGGLAPQSTELFYNEMIRLCQKQERVEYPQLLINSLQWQKFVSLLDSRDEDKI